MAFKIDDKVICVDDSISQDKAFEILKDFQTWVVKGNIYYIRDVLYNDGIVTGVLLKDVWNMPIYIRLINRVQEPAFGTFRFRKMKKDSSEIFIEEELELSPELEETSKLAS